MRMDVVAVFTGLFPPAARGGGPIRSTEAMIRFAPESLKPIVITSDHDLGQRNPMSVPRNRWTVRNEVSVRYTTAGSLVKMLRGCADVKRRHPALLYFNSFFSPGFTILPLMLWRFGYWGKPILLLAPRGEFGGGALSQNSWKKRLYIQLFRLLGIHRSVIWHSTADHETDDIRRQWGDRANIVVRENRTLLPAEPWKPARAPREVPRFAFVGRIVEHKGLAVALEALSRISCQLSLHVHGPEEDSAYADKCKRLAENLPKNIEVCFKGALAPGDVRQVLSKYDALLMPTAGENFGHIIAEALSVSCPVVTTSSTPWTEILQAGGGVVVENRDLKAWGEVIGRFASLSAETRMDARKSAGDAYRAWRQKPEKPHVWTLALEMARA